MPSLIFLIFTFLFWLTACNIRKGNPLILFNIFASVSLGIILLLWLLLWSRRKRD
ncbi:MAG: hypothetical protein NZ551_09175 [Microscillaceae bacterium]|nr:hypothetical protein [Microscillaceae bacterium]MDW8461371.1 hypothetical protein [Cytophagales bacterium]